MIRIEVDPITARRLVEALLHAAGEPAAVSDVRDSDTYRRRYRSIADDLGDALDALPPARSEPLEIP